MKSTLIATAAFAALAAATPLNEKRAYYTSWVDEYVTVTVTAGQEVIAPTPVANYGGWGNWGHKPETTSTSMAAPAPVEPAPSSSSTWSQWSSEAPAPSQSEAPAPSQSEAPAPLQSASAPSGGNAGDYGSILVQQHNYHRANHSAPDVQWDNDLASIAQQIAETCVYEHNTAMGGGGYGQNIGAGSPPEDAPGMVTNEMYNGEINSYPGYDGEPDMSNFENWGHFSQIVWKDTTTIGCYTAHCPNGLQNVGSDVSPYFTVCNYKPPGNYGGQYAANILAPKGDATVVYSS